MRQTKGDKLVKEDERCWTEGGADSKEKQSGEEGSKDKTKKSAGREYVMSERDSRKYSKSDKKR